MVTNIGPIITNVGLMVTNIDPNYSKLRLNISNIGSIYSKLGLMVCNVGLNLRNIGPNYSKVGLRQVEEYVFFYIYTFNAPITKMEPGGSGGGGGEDKYKDATNVKELLDRIGEDIYKKANEAAKKYTSQLHGRLSEAKFEKLPTGQQTPPNPCDLDYQWHTNATNVRSYPCRAGKEERFSQVHGGECDDKKIEGNGRNNGGACAPFRRLHLCVRNLENININKYINKDTLLADVCLAAKYEGDLIKTHYTPYQHKYDDSPSQLCTMLARSFADIGDIVRGKDLYLGGRGRDQLESKLKEIFEKIYKDLTKKGAKDHYQDDGTGNYYQLREDWWNANREMVWYAITCGAAGSQYFRGTCGSGKTLTQGDCRCKTNVVPTYFDYVPQYLRWFEEWAEDFCRKRKKQLTDAIKNCRGDSGKERYCDLNGFDCTQTIRAQEKLVKGANCHDCSVTCIPFGPWIDNQKNEFDKQKRKYDKEIKEDHGTTIKTANGKTINNLYVKEFYKELNKQYGDVEEFLKKLSEEQICKDPPQVLQETADASDFTEGKTKQTFDHTEYCQACHWCGSQKGEGGKWKAKNEHCANLNKKKNYKEENINKIPVLTPEEGKKGILKKYENFCGKGKNGAPATATGKNGNQIVTWQCYYDEEKPIGQNNNCILGDWQNVKEEDKIMSYNAFFWKWVYDMLIDSMQWRDEHGRCINKDNGKTCKRGCNTKCECFLKWVQQKQNEWEQVKAHYEKEEGFDYWGRYWTLGHLLNEYFPKIKAPYKEVKSVEEFIKEMEQIIKQYEWKTDATKENNSIDKVLDHEQKEAKKCTSIHSDDKCPPKPPQPADKGVAPSDPPREDITHHEDEEDPVDDPNNIRSIEFEDEKGKEPVFEVEEETQAVEEGDADETHKATGATEVTQPEEAEPPTTDPSVDVCNIVSQLFSDTKKFSDACKLKYGPGGKENFPNWKCVSSGEKSGSDATTRSSGESTTSSGTNQGSICVPPRRRRLYVTPLTKWADNSGSNTVVSGDSSQGNGASTSTSQTSLRRAFVESAAVETFFAWHKYKMEKKKEKEAAHGVIYTPTVKNDDPQKKLEGGEIPEEFKRQMFYTLGDYRDILVRGGDVNSGSKKEVGGSKENTNNDKTNIVLLASENKQEMQEIQKKIDKILKQSDTSGGTPPGKPSGQQRENLWSKYAEPIWHGMICALTYRDSGEKGEPPKHLQDVEKAFFGDKDKPATPDKHGTGATQNGTTETSNGTFENNYKYETVSFGASGTDAKGNDDPINNPKLKNFVERPPYFRYLEEWGETFCRQRTRMLKQVETNCEQDGEKQYSGDGEDCLGNLPDDPTTFNDLVTTCPKSCRSYKKWIERKGKEFEEQKNAYDGQKDKCVNGNNKGGGDNEFCKTLTTSPRAAAFLQKLGPCKNENDNGNGTIDFDDKTFQHAKNCAPCSSFKINCRNANCTVGGTNDMCKGNNKTITADRINGSTQDFDILVSDNIENKSEKDLEACREAHIFKSFRKDEWTCGKVCGYVVCKPKNGNRKENENQILLFNALLKRWVEYFLEDYKKIKHKISHCTKNRNGSTCINGCVDQWINQKRTEWETIRDRFNDQYKNKDESYPVRSFLETLIPQITDANANNDGKKLIKLSQFDTSCGCSASVNEQNKNGHKDAIECMLNKLEDKAKNCKDNPPTSDEEKKPCDVSNPLVEDVDDYEEQNPENKVGKPAICGNVDTTEQEEKGGCTPDVKEEEEEKEETNVIPESEDSVDSKPKHTKPLAPPAPEPPPPRRLPPRRPRAKDLSEHPAVIPALMSSTIMWSIGIGNIKKNLLK
ncbi:hypothetical protein PFUGPA_05990 [Plasmodium falciparum Palo Alto/Uganda]|uniref:Erythrocyte membrane protein 1 n=1 Tax=Plasmodium falciparum (isolate Palo Alto / Uganda) TaxID=57270 RepID=W4IRE2_PLAFP|nr:hypothetical protein PFUGPA_05990 [Plasmodium falciparum Palo Alto/Uganda]